MAKPEEVPRRGRWFAEESDIKGIAREKPDEAKLSRRLTGAKVSLRPEEVMRDLLCDRTVRGRTG